MTKATNIAPDDQSYWAIVRRQFRKNRSAVWSLRLLALLFLIGMSADFIANEKPYYCVINGKSYFPVLKGAGVDLGIARWPTELSNVTWRELKYEKVIWAPIPYYPTNLDKKNTDFVSPMAHQDVPSAHWKHYLGTDNLGRDVLSGMIHGTRIAMLVGVISMSVALIIGLFFGSLAGYFGDTKLKTTWAGIILNLFFLFFAFYYAFAARSYTLSDAIAVSFFGFLMQFFISLIIFILVMTIPYFISGFLRTRSYGGAEVEVPVDILISRMIEIIESVPSFLLILSIVAIVEKPSIYIVMVIIGLGAAIMLATYR